MINAEDPDLIGRLKAFESFIVSPGNQFGIIGDIVDGTIRPGVYVHIQLNSMLSLSAKIDEVKEIQLSQEKGQHKLLLFNEPDGSLNEFLHMMNIGNEIVEIRISGDD